jgi:hypothetical protein
MPGSTGKTVAELLMGKKASIKGAPLDPGSPSWDDIMELTWEEILIGAKRNKPGFKTIKKLLGSKEYDK